MANMFLLKRSEMYFIKLIGLLTGFVLLANINLVSATTYTQENYFEEDKFTPNFLTLGQKYSIPIGSTVVLPCKINKTVNTGHYSLVWKRDIAVLTAEKVIVTVNPRIRLMSNIDTSENSNYETKSYNLEIREVRTTDAGDYACQIGTMVPKEIIHTLEILVPPKIEYMNPSSRLDINQGAAIRIECRASGNPLPKIIWTRKNNIMFNGEPNITKDVLEILHANRHSTGLYKCSADNRVGQTDSREIFVNVLHPPEIEVERPYVHTGVGFEAQLVCIVHAEPPPNIVWFKDDIQLGTTEIYSQQARGNRYSLIIRNVTFTDFGNYTCQANNNLGKEKALVKLTGIPSICVFDSPTLGDYRDQYNISWSVITYAPIREYRLYYVKQNTHNSIQDNSVNHGYGGSSSSSSSSSSSLSSSSISGNINQISFDQWENIIIPGKPSNEYSVGGSSNIISNSINHFHYVQQFPHHHSKQHMYYMIKNLTPSTNYIVRIQARNEHGWNKISGVFHFSTRAEDLEMEPSAQPAVSKNIENIGSYTYSFAPKQFVLESTNLKYFLYFIYFINIFRILS